MAYNTSGQQDALNQVGAFGTRLYFCAMTVTTMARRSQEQAF